LILKADANLRAARWERNRLSRSSPVLTRCSQVKAAPPNCRWPSLFVCTIRGNPHYAIRVKFGTMQHTESNLRRLLVMNRPSVRNSLCLTPGRCDCGRAGNGGRLGHFATPFRTNRRTAEPSCRGMHSAGYGKAAAEHCVQERAEKVTLVYQPRHELSIWIVDGNCCEYLRVLLTSGVSRGRPLAGRSREHRRSSENFLIPLFKIQASRNM
jgi:hypothetical protein